MKILRFCVIEQQLKANECNTKYIVSNTHNYLQLKFNFSNDWQGLEKHIQFTLNNEHYEYLLADDNTIQVPKIFVEALSFKFLIIGYNISEETRVTTNTLNLNLKATDWSEDITSYEDNTHDTYSVLSERIDDTYTQQQTENLIGANVKQALNLITWNIRTYGE